MSEGGGPFLNRPNVLFVFWGAIWNTNISPGVGDIFAAITSLSTPSVNAYGSYSYFDGLGSGWGFDIAQPPLVVTSSSVTIPASFAQSDIENAARAIANTLGPHLSWDLVVIFLPPGYSSPLASGAHAFYQDGGEPSIEYVWVSYSAQLATITFILSHELVETMTDPHGDGMQVDPRNSGPGGTLNEICDVCCSTGNYNGVTVTSYFSQSAGACILPSPPVPSLPPDDYLIDSVHKVYDTEHTNPTTGARERLQFIQSVSGPGTTGGRWTMAEADVVALINAGKATFYTLVDNQRANVIVERWYLKTVADGFVPNNLDALPQF